jgi:hypothetical protein
MLLFGLRLRDVKFRAGADRQWISANGGPAGAAHRSLGVMSATAILHVPRELDRSA